MFCVTYDNVFTVRLSVPTSLHSDTTARLHYSTLIARGDFITGIFYYTDYGDCHKGGDFVMGRLAN